MNKTDIENRLYSSVLFVTLITFSYFKASLSSCGISDANRYFNTSISSYDNPHNHKSITNVSANDYTNCEFCNRKKFLRSSHCRTCNVCVLRRDHHCIWIANCVGIGNNRVFFIFCFWVTVNFFYLIFLR